MSDSKISALAAAAALSGAEVVPVVQSGATVGASVAQIVTSARAGLAPVAISGNYGDLSSKPTIPSTAADVGAVAATGGTATALQINSYYLPNSTNSASGTIDINVGTTPSKYVAANGALAFTFSGTTAGFTYGFVLTLINGGNFVVSWPSTVKWAGGVAPTLTTNGRDVLAFMTLDNGASWQAALSIKDAK